MDDPGALPENLLQEVSTTMNQSAIQCCCGREECPYLAHNSTTLESVEKDLLSAARIGQALLERHESHMAEAEEERKRMSTTIDDLEDKRKELEISNARVIAENRDLLNQLEQLNNQVVESDVEVQSLTATLAATRLELQKLTSLAERAEELEKQLSHFEHEHADLLSKHSTTEDENRSSIQRWKRAEGTIIYLQDQIDRIEREAREERQRHVEVMDRMERRRAVERELEKAAGRLKGAAAAKSVQDQPGTNVVSHFVRDILQDNANLQNGVVELREMLLESNSEVENLREQLLLHQPIESRTSTLKAELSSVEPQAEAVAVAEFEAVPELHVHHHYHAPEVTVKRPKKKRAAVTTGHFMQSGASTPIRGRSKDWRFSSSSANTILSQTSVTIPPNRWSTQSSQTGYSYAASSIPSSPRRDSSVFDSMDHVFASRPSTPDSSIMDETPPTEIKAETRSTLSQGLAGHRSVSTPTPLQLSRKTVASRMNSVDEFDELDPMLLRSPQSTILEEPDFTDTDSTISSTVAFTRPLHRRAASHESLFSLSEAQRPLKSQLSQNFGISNRGFSPIIQIPTTAKLAIEPAFVHASASATRKIPARKGSQDSDLARSVLSQFGTPTTATAKKPSGGWAWSRWGKAPIQTTSIPDSPQTPKSPFIGMMRNPGVNQTGWVRGLKPPPPTPSSIEPSKIDVQALKEALQD